MNYHSVTKFFTFDSCHHLPKHEGKCKNLHGHTYKLEITITGTLNDNPNSPEFGMIIDFSKLKDIIQKTVISKYDHNNLNNFFDNPTAEIMAEKIFKDIDNELKLYENLDNVKKLKKVILYETPTSYAEYGVVN